MGIRIAFVSVALFFAAPLSASAESVHLFDDLNGDGVSDTEQKTTTAANSNAPSEESIDADQPEDLPEDTESESSSEDQ